MAVVASSFRRRYTPRSVQFAADPRPPPPLPRPEAAAAPAPAPVIAAASEVEWVDAVTVEPAPCSAPAATQLHAQTASPSLANHAYTSSPWRLLAHDLVHFARLAWALPSFLWPLQPAAPLSELAPTLANAWCIALHASLAVLQLALLFGIAPAAGMLLPTWMCVSVVASCIGASHVACRLLLNGWRGEAVMQSSPACVFHRPEHAGEQWIFVNGVGTGRHWMQRNLDRLACTFQRPVLGIHNKTSGLVFDVVECLVQRSFGYATRNVRTTYGIVRDTLRQPDITKVVLVLHSQGGIVGSMVLDWLLQELPRELLAKLEIYTFGNAANHFNALPLPLPLRPGPGHIEHYAHAADVVARWGVLHYAAAQRSPFAGRVFVRTSPRGGHQFCQHYMDSMFPVVRDGAAGAILGCAEESEFMESQCVGPDETASSAAATAARTPTRVKDVSRLWQYRNGRCPDEL